MPFPNPSTQWKPGQTGNPYGRPPKGIITDIAVRLLHEKHPKKPDQTRAEVIAEKWLDRAENDDESLEKLQNRVEGKVPDRMPVNDDGSNERELTPEELAAFENGEGAGTGEPSRVRMDSEQEEMASGQTSQTPESEAS